MVGEDWAEEVTSVVTVICSYLDVWNDYDHIVTAILETETRRTRGCKSWRKKWNQRRFGGTHVKSLIYSIIYISVGGCTKVIKSGGP